MANIPGWIGELTGSTSGSLVSGAAADVTLNQRTFFPNIRMTADDEMAVVASTAGSPTDQTGLFRVKAGTGDNATYDVRWRYIQV